MLLHAVRNASAGDRDKAVAVLSYDRPSLSAGIDTRGLLDRLVLSGDLTPAGMATLRSALAAVPEKTWGDIQWLHGLLVGSGSLDHARRVAAGLADHGAAQLAALDAIPPSPHRSVLEALVDFVHERVR
jgi:geranylgeranyl diphosphate synthase type II